MEMNTTTTTEISYDNMAFSLCHKVSSYPISLPVLDAATSFIDFFQQKKLIFPDVYLLEDDPDAYPIGVVFEWPQLGVFIDITDTYIRLGIVINDDLDSNSYPLANITMVQSRLFVAIS